MDIKKLTIEIEGKPLTPLVKVYADGKKLGRLTKMKITADDEDILVNIELMESKVVEIDGKKQTVREPLVLNWKH